jgi:hypothetical protein
MFQGSDNQPSPFWKFIPIALVVFGLIVAGAIYVSHQSKPVLEELHGVLHEGDPDFEWYSQYLELKNPKIQMGLNYARNRIVMFTGVFANNGERTIDVIELKVEFYNYEQLLAETIRTPLRPGPYTPAIPPLTERGFSFYIEDTPEGWGASHAEMSIFGFRFRTSGSD